MVCLERVRRLRRRARGLADESDALAGRLIGLAYTFLFVAFARILFVAPDLGGAVGVRERALVGQAKAARPVRRATPRCCWRSRCTGCRWTWRTRARDRFFTQHVVVQGMVLAGFVLVLVALASESRPFVYFQF